MIPVYVLALLASFFAATWLVNRDVNRAGGNGKPFADSIWTGLLIGLLVYRFGGIVFRPVQFSKNPMQILWVSPESYMTYVGILAGAVYAGWKIYRSDFAGLKSVSPFVNVILPGILAGAAIYQLFSGDLGKPTYLIWGVQAGAFAYHPLHLYRGIGLLLLGIGLRTQSVPVHSRLGWGLLLGGIVVMFVSFFGNPGSYLLGMTPLQWGSLLASAVGLILISRMSKKLEK